MPDCILLLDLGNTRLKYRFTDPEGKVLREGMVLNENLPDGFPAGHLQPISIVMIRSGPDIFNPGLNWNKAEVWIPGPEDFREISWAYPLAGTLGRDRMAAMMGARSLFPNKHIVIADAGSCLTVDYLASDGKHLGGFISPGYQMRLRSMNVFTGSLPAVSSGIPASADPGNSTENCMISGALYGLKAELDFHFETAAFDPGKPEALILSGGDAKDLAHHLKQSTFVAEDLVFTGLYQAFAGRFQ